MADMTKKMTKFLGSQFRVDAFIEKLKCHRRLENPIVSDKLEDFIGIRDASFRGVIHILRKTYPIGSGREGYFYCYTIEDIEATRAHLKSRYVSIIEAEGYMEDHLKRMEGSNSLPLFVGIKDASFIGE